MSGSAFPDRVIALTWDDGPDSNTLRLAEWLSKRRISATFFVVGSWMQGVSDDPGDGARVFATGYEYIPILGDLVALGHRLGNHTLHHMRLREAAGAARIASELAENQKNLDPYLVNELRMFRAPGGGWGAAAQRVVDRDPYLSSMVGPFGWDVDRKDWDESLVCRDASNTAECERAAPGHALRMKAAVVAARYVASIERAGHGIVLLHDRVGHVGSTYGLDLAQAMIPELEAKGFVFAAPLLRFSPLAVRYELASSDLDPSTIRLTDADRDGRADLCGQTSAGTRCVRSVTQHPPSGLPKTVFRSALGAAGSRAPALEPSNVRGKSATRLVGDLNGDGRQDRCEVTRDGVACAFGSARGLTRATIWVDRAALLAQGWDREERARTLQLADINGDGRADICGQGPAGIVCGLAP